MESIRPGSSQTGFTLLIVSISLANFMAAFDGTIVNVALPTISKLFNILPGTASWTLTVYVLVMAGFVLIFGKTSDIIGFKKMFLSGFLIFTLGSFFCGFLPEFLNSFPVLIASRALQGVGASMITAIGPAMVAAYLPMELRGKAMGTIFTFAGLGMAIGPTAGGILTQYLSWGWIFFINVPIGIGAILLGSKVIPEMPSKQWSPGFDHTGAVLIFVGLGSLLFTFSEGQIKGWNNPVIIGSSMLAVLTLAGFVLAELRASDPLLEMRLFQKRNFFLTNAMTILMFITFNGLVYLVPFYLQLVQKLSPSVVGLIFTSFPIALMAGGTISGILYNRVGGRLINIAACIPVVAGYSLISGIQPDMSSWYIVLCLALIGFGSGLIWTSGSNMVIHSISKKYQGMISGFISLSRFIPLIIGIPIFNIVFMYGIPGINFRNELSMATLTTISTTDLASGFHLAFSFALIISIVLFVVTFLVHQEIHPDYLSDTHAKTR
ncbi:MAG: MFS transporter [Methanospirillum sp.]|uniref:MFS transporter n=1 Tax=Methanospirillum sp. TaxID=45200 RepID=UPI00236E0C66|nr:MFS transporter [Methanospirillum sp.]MDD1729774.1 MFS transporter [Methanospirillum sp.]